MPTFVQAETVAESIIFLGEEYAPDLGPQPNAKAWLDAIVKAEGINPKTADLLEDQLDNELTLEVAFLIACDVFLIEFCLHEQEDVVAIKNDIDAQVYLREAMTYQEIHMIDNFTYTISEAELQAEGLKVPPSKITFTIVSADATNYCMTAKHNNGSGKVFRATSYEGITENKICIAEDNDQ